jgi:hypothetical protein
LCSLLIHCRASLVSPTILKNGFATVPRGRLKIS